MKANKDLAQRRHTMLQQVQDRDRELANSRDLLEQRVIERTAELTIAKDQAEAAARANEIIERGRALVQGTLATLESESRRLLVEAQHAINTALDGSQPAEDTRTVTSASEPDELEQPSASEA